MQTLNRETQLLVEFDGRLVRGIHNQFHTFQPCHTSLLQRCPRQPLTDALAAIFLQNAHPQLATVAKAFQLVSGDIAPTDHALVVHGNVVRIAKLYVGAHEAARPFQISRTHQSQPQPLLRHGAQAAVVAVDGRFADRRDYRGHGARANLKRYSKFGLGPRFQSGSA